MNEAAAGAASSLKKSCNRESPARRYMNTSLIIMEIVSGCFIHPLCFVTLFTELMWGLIIEKGEGRGGKC